MAPMAYTTRRNARQAINTCDTQLLQRLDHPCGTISLDPSSSQAPMTHARNARCFGRRERVRSIRLVAYGPRHVSAEFGKDTPWPNRAAGSARLLPKGRLVRDVLRVGRQQF